MNTRDRLNKFLTQSGAVTAPTMIAESIRFLCSEIDRLQAPSKVRYQLLYEDSKTPVYHTEGASGLDLHTHALFTKANCTDFPYVLEPYASVMIWCGVAFEIPVGWEVQIRPRSSLSKERIHVCLGTIDSDYRGELGVRLINLSDCRFVINKDDRVAQAVFVPVGHFELEQAQTLSPTARGDKGFGSSGK